MTVEKMTREAALARLEDEFGLRPGEFYLLELLPLVEMMWADGINQEEEVNLVYEYVLRHVAELNRAADGEEVVSVQDVNNFLDRFVHQQPDPIMLRRLRNMALPLFLAGADPAEDARRGRKIFDLCLDIAAAAVTSYPYDRHERITAKEKDLLHEFARQLDICREPPAEG